MKKFCRLTRSDQLHARQRHPCKSLQYRQPCETGEVHIRVKGYRLFRHMLLFPRLYIAILLATRLCFEATTNNMSTNFTKVKTPTNTNHLEQKQFVIHIWAFRKIHSFHNPLSVPPLTFLAKYHYPSSPQIHPSNCPTYLYTLSTQPPSPSSY